MTVPGTPVKGERTSGAGRRLRSFVAVLVVVALGSLGVLWTQTGTVAAFHIPWLLLAALFYLAEVCLVHLHFRRGAHSFSMSEVPLVLGLFFATPRELLLAQFVGCALALAVQRRQSLLKAAFNLANFAVTTSVAVFLLRAIVPVGSHFDIRAWVGAVVATMVYAVLGSVAVGVGDLALRASRRSWTPRIRIPHAARFVAHQPQPRAGGGNGPRLPARGCVAADGPGRHGVPRLSRVHPRT